MIIAILMAGGKGTRLNRDIEKPLLEFKSKPLIDNVLNNLSKSRYIDEIIIATSPNTPKTKKHVSNSNSYIETSGKGYLKDLSYLLSYFEKKSKKDVLLFINADLPLVSTKTIDYILKKYLESDKPAMSVLVPIAIFKEYGIKPSYVFENLVPSGVNILISENIVQEEEKLIIPKLELALNINTIEDLNLANELY